MTDSKGLSTKEALETLEKELKTLVARHRSSTPVLSWAKDAWLPGSPYSLFRITSFLVGLLLCLALLGSTHQHSGTSRPQNFVTATILLILLVFNLVLSGWDSYQRSWELGRRVENVATLVNEVASGRAWDSTQYPQLDTPPSDSLVLQWTQRDGLLVNLPWALLVEGDVILLKPGQPAPALCSSIEDDNSFKLSQDEVWEMQEGTGAGFHPEFIPRVKPKKFRLEETPCIAEVHCVLDSATKRPLSQLHKERRFLIGNLLEYLLLPAFLLTVLAWNCIRMQLLDPGSLSLLPIPPLDSVIYKQLFLLEPVAASIPLLPVIFPAWWMIITTAAFANVLTLFKQKSLLHLSNEADPFDDTVETPDMEDIRETVSWRCQGKIFLSCILGTGQYLCRTENLLHCLGTVTSFCCSDSKGVLSWPNTSLEKIFFLKQKDQDFQDGGSLRDGGEVTDGRQASNVVPEILTVTHEVHNPFRIDFDDTDWDLHIASLKPLGLAGLLNTCSLLKHEKLCAKNGDNLLSCPRDCLCELSTRIGVRAGPETNWKLEQSCYSCRHNSSKGITPGQCPCMVSRALMQKDTGRQQLVSQGNGDIVLDSCIDAWTGADLVTLTPALRKKCLEFHHRASLTSFCTAFSFRPLMVIPTWPQDHTLLLPSHSSPLLTSWHSYQSLDCISCPDNDLNGTVDFQPDLKCCLDTQATQSFLGMVQMQYPARVDMVQFIDHLEKACIRFVHFSKDNELRSRVFSEKLGLESGWNCHISLAPSTNLASIPTMMYTKNRDTLNIKSGKEVSGQIISKSMPVKIDKQSRLLDFTSWWNKPLLGESSESIESHVESMYDMSNRAQLPAGIDAIRPHLEKMDNVPLLVSLFTDCTPSSTKQMVEIMQENGEVVAMLGSSANFQNMKLFLAADASLAVEPLYPQVCQHIPVFTTTTSGLSPTALAQQIVAVASSVTFTREEDIFMYQAIIASRRHVLAIKHCLRFWTSSCIFLSFLPLSSILMTAPLPITPAQIFVLCSFHIPVLATAIFCSNHDKNIRNISTGKNTPVSFSRAKFCESSWSYGLMYLPSILSILATHVLSVLSFCSLQDLNKADEIDQCNSSTFEQLTFLQGANMTFSSFALTLASLTFVSSTDHVWKYKPRRSWHILVAICVLVIGQLIYLLYLSLNYKHNISTESWMILGTNIPITMAVNELIKRHQIKVNVRFQKRARLEFGTKLGMNSPF